MPVWVIIGCLCGFSYVLRFQCKLTSSWPTCPSVAKPSPSDERQTEIYLQIFYICNSKRLQASWTSLEAKWGKKVSQIPSQCWWAPHKKRLYLMVSHERLNICKFASNLYLTAVKSFPPYDIFTLPLTIDIHFEHVRVTCRRLVRKKDKPNIRSMLVTN